MDFSEFKRRLGAEPHSRDPDLAAARASSAEFEEAAREALALEEKLARAFALPTPDDLQDRIDAVARQATASLPRSSRWPLALAASVLVAVGAAGLIWNNTRSWDSVEEYLVAHYRHDGAQLITRAGQGGQGEVQSVLASFDVRATPALADLVGVIKYCPTPDGKGVHMVLNTESGPVTVIYMPETHVTDHEELQFDDVQALLVELGSGSAAIIGAGTRQVRDLYALVHDSIVPLAGRT